MVFGINPRNEIVWLTTGGGRCESRKLFSCVAKVRRFSTYFGTIRQKQNVVC